MTRQCFGSRAWFMALVGMLACGPVAPAWGASDAGLYADADARIERHRKADAVVLVVDVAGKPVPGARVTVEQKRHAFLFGCNMYIWGRVGDETAEKAYREQFTELLNYATLGFYWASYERQRGQPAHTRTERTARWCRENGIITKGHPLAWNHADPGWLPEDLDEVRSLQMARIDDCVSRFKGLIDVFDVVNEATHFDRKEFVERAPKMTAMWQKVGQVAFPRECFTHARKANPGATLLINDYRIDPEYCDVIEKLVDENGKRMYDVIGIQSHMHMGTWPDRKIWDVCERFSKFGVPLHFTEMTILSGRRGIPVADRKGRPWPSTPEGEAYQAREVERFYKMLFSHPAVEAITWWDFSDRGAWQGAPAGLIRKDMSPKPAYDTLKKLIKGRWWTRATVTADAEGRAGFRGFFGDYEITVTAADKNPVAQSMQVTKGGTNRLTVKLR